MINKYSFINIYEHKKKNSKLSSQILYGEKFTILKKDLFREHKVKNFSISEIWNELLKKNELNGFESLNKFYHLTNLEIFKKLKDL